MKKEKSWKIWSKKLEEFFEESDIDYETSKKYITVEVRFKPHVLENIVRAAHERLMEIDTFIKSSIDMRTNGFSREIKILEETVEVSKNLNDDVEIWKQENFLTRKLFKTLIRIINKNESEVILKKMKNTYYEDMKRFFIKKVSEMDYKKCKNYRDALIDIVKKVRTRARKSQTSLDDTKSLDYITDDTLSDYQKTVLRIDDVKLCDKSLYKHVVLYSKILSENLKEIEGGVENEKN